MRVSATALALVLATVAITPAQAQSGWKLAAGAGSDNRARDTSKSDGEAYVWGRAIWNNETGSIYAGPAFETLDMGGAKIGTGVLVGTRQQIAGFSIDANAAYKVLVDANTGFDDDTWEFSVDMKRSYGQAMSRLRVQYSPDGLGGTEAWTWVSAQAGWAFTDKLRASAEIGYRDQQQNIDYTGYNIGASYSLTPQMELDLRWHGTDADVRTEQYKDKFVVNVSRNF